MVHNQETSKIIGIQFGILSAEEIRRTSIGPINDRDTFMKWCYQTPPTCKEGNGLQCAANQLGEHRGMGSGLANGPSSP